MVESHSGFSIEQIAGWFGLPFKGDGSHQILGVASLSQATPYDLTFLANPHYRQFLDASKAGVVVLSPKDIDAWHGNKIISDNPYLSYALIAQKMFSNSKSVAVIHPSAVIHESAKIGKNVSIGPHVVVDENVVIGDDCVLHANTFIGRHCDIGAHVIIHVGVVIGSDGFGFAYGDDQWHKVPQLGRVVIKDNVEVGANTTIDRGALGDTVIDEGVKLDNQIQVAHNVHIGAHTAVAGCTAIAGSTTIGQHCRIAGHVGIVGHLTIADNVVVTAMTLVTKSISRPGVYSGAFGAQPASQWRKLVASVRRFVKS